MLVVAQKQSVGIDVSKSELVVVYGFLTIQGQLNLSKAQSFSNTSAGHEQLVAYLKSCSSSKLPLSIILEATSVYHQSVTYHLTAADYPVSVVPPLQANLYAKSLGTKTKTDQVDAKILAHLGLERTLTVWTPPQFNTKELKEICREYAQLTKDKTVLTNRLAAYTSAKAINESTINRTKKMIDYHDQQLLNIEKQIKTIIKTDQILKEQVNRLASIKGVGILTAAKVIAETDNFAQVKNAKQLASYAGLDIQQHQSGKRSGKTHISKKGNKWLRSALHMSAMSMATHVPKYKEFYDRLVLKSGSGNFGLVALARKILHIMWALVKNKTTFDVDYQA